MLDRAVDGCDRALISPLPVTFAGVNSAARIHPFSIPTAYALYPKKTELNPTPWRNFREAQMGSSDGSEIHFQESKVNKKIQKFKLT